MVLNGFYNPLTQEVTSQQFGGYHYNVVTGSIYRPGRMACSDAQETWVVYLPHEEYQGGTLLAEWDTSLKTPLNGGVWLYADDTKCLFQAIREYHESGKTGMTYQVNGETYPLDIDVSKAKRLYDAKPWLKPNV